MKIPKTTTRWTTTACLLALIGVFGGCAADEESEVTEIEAVEPVEIGTGLATDPLATDPPGSVDPLAEPRPPATGETAAPGAAPAAAPAAAVSGQQVFQASCETCHDASDMAGVGDRVDRAALTSFLRGETEIEGSDHPGEFDGSPEELEAVVSWVLEQS